MLITSIFSTPSNDAIILANASTLLGKEEGFKSSPYLDTAQVPTIGFGTVYYLNGTKVTMNDSPISLDEGLVLLNKRLSDEFLPALKSLCPTLITINQAVALLSFVYNEGVHALANSTLRRKVLASDWAGAAAEFPKWNMAGGQVSHGLQNRRAVEQALFNTP